MVWTMDMARGLEVTYMNQNGYVRRVTVAEMAEMDRGGRSLTHG